MSSSQCLMNWRDIGRRLDPPVSGEGARQIFNRAIEKLQNSKGSAILNEYLFD